MQFLLSIICTPSITVSVMLVCISIYLLHFTKCDYWKVRGVPYFKPVVPIFGSMYDIIFFKSLVDISNRIYNKTRGLPYVGIYAFYTPVLYVRDLDVVSSILVKDFQHFEDRGFHINSNDSLGRNLIHQTGADWKFSRSKLSPCFSVNRVKSMLPIMIDKSKVLVGKLEQDHSKNKPIETWETCLRYTTDVITLSTIGVDPDSLSKKQEHFWEAGSHMLGVYFIYHVFTGCFFPGLHRYLGISVCKARVKCFFHDVINQIVNHRKDYAVEKKDILQTLLQLKEENNSFDKTIPEIDDNFVVAQSFIFFLAGFETPGNILACALFDIAKQPKIQVAMCAEISRVLKKHGGQITFEALQDMKYMKQVVSETLRKYAPLSLIFRRCTKDYVIPGTSTVVEKGTLILIPLSSIQMDPQYHPDPEVFDPDRFSDESCAARHTAAFMPFGIGPRFCPAVLYSYIKIKTALVHILRQFEVCASKNTPHKLEPSAVDFLFTPKRKNGIPLNFRRRENPLS